MLLIRFIPFVGLIRPNNYTGGLIRPTILGPVSKKCPYPKEGCGRMTWWPVAQCPYRAFRPLWGWVQHDVEQEFWSSMISVRTPQRAPRCFFAALALRRGNVASVVAAAPRMAAPARLWPRFPSAAGCARRIRPSPERGSGVADSSSTGGTVPFRWRNDSFLTLTNATST